MRSRWSGVPCSKRFGRTIFLGVWLISAAFVGALARPAQAASDEPGVARVSLIEGDVSYLRGDADDWTGVAVNAPLVTGDRFYTGADSRAEIQLDPAVYARISSETEVSMLELGPDTTQVRMSLGLATFRVRRVADDRHVEIDTPGAALVVREAGVYRVTVQRNGDTDVQVRDGAVTAYVAGETYQIGDGRGVAIDGIGDAARPRIYAASGSDGWDQWEAQRAQRVDNAVSSQYVSDGIYGAEDLDDHGDWEYESEYGNVWRPRVAAGWAPYTDGRWVWVDPWGWTWLDYSSWGWAPFHYGRWVYVNDYWGWAPGPIIAAPVYAPALVGWFGGGWGGVSVGVGFGAIGWTPLGWGEPCFPWWGGWGGVAIGRPWWGGWGGPRIYNNTVINKNITNINVNNYNFGNLRHAGGFSSVPISDFRSGRGRITPVGGRRVGDFRAIDGRVPIAPTRDSLPAANPSRGFGSRTVQPPSNVEGRRVVTARTPTTGGQPSFDRKLPVLERNPGAPLTPTTLREMGRDGGRAPLVQSVTNRGTTGREVRTLPSRASDGSGVQARGGSSRTTPTIGPDGVVRREAPDSGGGSYDRAGRERAGTGRETMTLPGARPLPGEGRRPSTGAPEANPGGRTVARPPATVDGGGRALPVAPRDGAVNRQPYVARRPASSGAPSAPGTSPGDTGSAVGGTPRTASPGGSGAPSRPAYPGGSSSGAPSRSAYPGGSVPSARSLPGGSTTREATSAPRSRSAPQAYPPSMRSAPAPDRGGGSRSYFSQPRTVTQREPRGGGVSRGYPSAPMRVAPSSRSAPPAGHGGAPRGYAGAPQMRSAPPQMRVPGGQSAPRSYAPAGRSMPSAPTGGGSSAPSAVSRGGFSSGGSGGAVSRSGGGMGGGFGGMGARSFGGGGRSGG